MTQQSLEILVFICEYGYYRCKFLDDNNPWLLFHQYNNHSNKQASLDNQSRHHNHPRHHYKAMSECRVTNLCCRNRDDIDSHQCCILGLDSQSHCCMSLCSSLWHCRLHSCCARRWASLHILNLQHSHPRPLGIDWDYSIFLQPHMRWENQPELNLSH